MRGSLRINVKKRIEAYVKIEGVPHDVWIDGDANRNRAFSKDIVAVRLLPSRLWRQRQVPSSAGDELPSNPHHNSGDVETPDELLQFAKDGTLQAQAVVVAIIETRRQEFQIGALIPANGAISTLIRAIATPIRGSLPGSPFALVAAHS